MNITKLEELIKAQEELNKIEKELRKFFLTFFGDKNGKFDYKLYEEFDHFDSKMFVIEPEFEGWKFKASTHDEAGGHSSFNILAYAPGTTEGKLEYQSSASFMLEIGYE
ncbi:MAG: hypothetical protein ACTSU7_11315 [Candidatus Heimdallarchaeaceae archaeon]